MRTGKQQRQRKNKASSNFKFTIKRLASGALESKICHLCCAIPSNHFCRYPVKGSEIFIEGEGSEICGKLACHECRSKWGNPGDYQNRCTEHANL